MAFNYYAEHSPSLFFIQLFSFPFFPDPGGLIFNGNRACLWGFIINTSLCLGTFQGESCLALFHLGNRDWTFNIYFGAIIYNLEFF